MDKDTRNRIQRATQAARNLLEQEYAEQLEGVFDIRLDGSIATAPGQHLDASQRVARAKLITAVEHLGGAGMSKADAVAAYLREAAFTTLNRFVALKMLEARDLVQECVSRDEQSAGFKEFTGLAPGLVQLPDHGYRAYIESIFDELSTEVKVLFERRDARALLWPKRATLDALLELLNATDLADVWGEDETIGWVYQFFNGDDERKQMRAESQAPRNSREMAVRNQFFTPRYVVQFLTDNTLGRIWYEMREKQTVLADSCEYMVRKPDETFEPRAKKDPRDLRVLDPACGSGHFLLYAFDLLLTMYEEAHADPESPKSKVTGSTLAAEYPTLEELRKAAPGLILAHNLHGVDIDARCAQIAQLALWMRAQRAYRDFGIGRAERPCIRKSNVVVAEPLVADDQLVAEFVERLGDPELGRVFTALVDALKLAGDLGLLLRVETLVGKRAAKGVTGDLFAPPEERIRATLARFVAEEGQRSSTRKRLFAEDATQGMGLLAVAEKKYDVVLMNPPFGEASLATRKDLYAAIPDASQDLFAAFIARATEMLRPRGRVGVLTNRLAAFNHQLAEWRDKCFYGGATSLAVMADLGFGVLDAVVEVAGFVFESEKTQTAVVISVLHAAEKRDELREALSLVARGAEQKNIHYVGMAEVQRFPASRFAYAVPHAWGAAMNAKREHPTFRGRQGINTGDDPRYYRTFWELDMRHRNDDWRWTCKGGEFARYQCNTHLMLRWSNSEHFRRTSNSEAYGQRGVTYTYRTTSNLSARAMTEGTCFSIGGPALLPFDPEHSSFLLAYANSFVATYCIESIIGGGDTSVKGTAARNLEPTYFQFLPPIEPSVDVAEWFRARVSNLVGLLESINVDETSPLFTSITVAPAETLVESAAAVSRWLWRRILLVYPIVRELEARISSLIAFKAPEVLSAYPVTGWPLPDKEDVGSVPAELLRAASAIPRDAPNQTIRDSCMLEYRFASKLSHYVHAEVEAIGHAYEISPEAICGALAAQPSASERFVRQYSWVLVSVLVGVAFRRWRSDVIVKELPSVEYRDIFRKLPWPQPAVETSTQPRAALVDDEGHLDDLSALVTAKLSEVLGATGSARIWSEEIAEALGATQSLRAWLRSKFFDEHIRACTRSRRASPIYWQLATPSASYSVWLYIHAFTKDTLFRVQNDYVAPKLAHEQRKLESMQGGPQGGQTAAERKALAAQETFVEELRTLLDEVKRVAPLWNPNLDDGVIINFSLLWRLVPQHKPWQKELKATWDALCAAQYDWAHLAMHLWPERVVPKCAEDRSLAIAHGLEEVFWVEGTDGKWTARETPTTPVAELIRERTSPAVQNALKQLLTASAPAGGGKAPKRGRKGVK